MWIVIEGSTCAGKSTLERLIQRRLEEPALRRHIDRVHMERPQELTRRWALNEYVIQHENRRPGHGHVLADRWHWGEATYAPIYRPDTNTDGFGLLGVAGWRWTEMFLMSRGAVTAYLHADPAVLVERLAERGDDHVTNDDELLQVAALYEQTRHHAASLVGLCDTGAVRNVDDFAKSIVSSAGRAELRASRISAWPQYIGTTRPKALLVGDARNVTKEYGDETQLPFMPVNSNSGDYLLRALPDPFWRSAGLINADEFRDEDFNLFWHALHRPQIVALGANARKALHRHGFKDFPTLFHPQYARRFRNAEINDYGKAIQLAAETGNGDPSWKL